MLQQIPFDHQAVSNVKSFDDSVDSSASLHVPSKQNPADCIMHGISSTSLKDQSLW